MEYLLVICFAVLVEFLLAPQGNTIDSSRLLSSFPFAPSNTMHIAAILIAIALVSAITRLLVLKKTYSYPTYISNEVTYNLASYIFNQPFLDYTSKASTYYSHTLTAQIDDVTRAVRFTFLFISSLMSLVFIFVALLYIEPITVIVGFSLLGIFYFCIYKWNKKKIRKLSISIDDSKSAQLKTTKEASSLYRESIVSQSQTKIIEKLYNDGNKIRTDESESIYLSYLPKILVEAFFLVFFSLVALLYASKNYTAIASLFGISLGAYKALPAIQGIYGSSAMISSYRASLENVSHLLCRKPVNNNVHYRNYKKDMSNWNSITLSNVNFRFPGCSNYIIKDLNLRIKRGAIIGIKGHTGSGKSTLADLISGIIFVEEGQILIDREVLNQSNTNSWYPNVAYLSQNIALQEGTILENIIYPNMEDSPDLSRVDYVLKASSLESYVKSLPMGTSTQIGEDGARMSGGQKQRLALARALYRKASLLILDEATSALDDKTEKHVMESIYNLPNNISVILIAHRLSTLQNCDFVVDMNSSKC